MTMDRRDLLKLCAPLVSAAVLFAPRSAFSKQAANTASQADKVSPDFLDEIAPGVFAHKGEIGLFRPDNAGDVSNCGFIVGNDTVAVIDTGGSAIFGQRFKVEIEKRTAKPIKYVLNTHMHPDHVFGNAAFESGGVTFIAHHKMARGLAARAERYLSVNKETLGAAFEGTRIVLPSDGVEGVRKLDLGGRELILEAHPTAHTDNDLTIRDSQTGTLFMGDLLFVAHTPAIDGSILGWIALIEKMRGIKAARVVAGHGPASLPWPAAIDPLYRYLTGMRDEIRTLIAKGGTLSQAAETVGREEKGAWELFEEYHARNVSAAFAELEWE